MKTKQRSITLYQSFVLNAMLNGFRLKRMHGHQQFTLDAGARVKHPAARVVRQLFARGYVDDKTLAITSAGKAAFRSSRFKGEPVW